MNYPIPSLTMVGIRDIINIININSGTLQHQGGKENRERDRCTPGKKDVT